MKPLSLGSILLLAFTIGVSSSASASFPRLTNVQPRGVQRGVESVVTFNGQNLQDAQEIFFYRPGVTATKIEPVNANSVKVTLNVAADCRVGERIAQVRTKSGISEYRTFYVGALPSADEKEPNSDFAAPQAVAMGTTVAGVVQSEDVDYYQVTVKKGERISAEIEAMRLGTTMFDPYVAILDSKRFELAVSDDAPLVYQDAVAAVVAPEDGNYIIEVRESAYGGNGASQYRLHVGHFPRPTAVYPAGGQIGTEVEVKFLGVPTGDFTQKFKLPAAVEPEYGLLPSDATGVPPSENTFRLFPHGNVLEVEPNDDFKTPTSAQLPLAFNGIIEKDADIDCFKFAAKKGEVYEVECYARRIRSGLDPVMNIYQADGRSLAGNDDSRKTDSYLRFSVPADGEYIIRITDHLGQGGADFVYRIEFAPVVPNLTLGIPRVTRYGQERQTVFVPKGNRYATLISATRLNFGGDLVLEGQGLPAGIKMHALPMPAAMSQMPVVFEAAPDAPIAGALVDFTAKHADPAQNIKGGFANKADMIIGAPGQSLYWTVDVNRLAMAVVDELPFTLQIVEPKVPIVRNGSMQLKVVATKKAGWDEEIRVEFPFRPPGVGANPNLVIPKGQTEALYLLNANGNAALGKWPVYCLGQANVNGPAYVASQLATIEIAEPYVQFAMDRSATEQGKPTEIVAKINVTTPFEGNAKVTLIGLPNKVAAPELEFNKDTKELVFPVTTDLTSPEGRHKNVFAQVIIPQSGEVVVHANVGTTELRIDKPLPPPKETPMPAPMPTAVAKTEPPKKEEPPARRLTRLEQLRLDAQKKAEAAGGMK
jgi:hypothetical protein